MTNLKDILILTIGVVLIALGFFNMHDSDTSADNLIKDVKEFKGERVKEIALRHIYHSSSFNTIDVSLVLEQGNTDGSVIIETYDAVEIDNNMGKRNSPISLHRSKNLIYINYTKKAHGIYKNFLKITLPAKEKKVMGIYVFNVPDMNHIRNDKNIISYEFYPSFSARVNISGTIGNTIKGRANGYKWNNLRAIDSGTTITVETPELKQKSQIALVFGAILIALGINLLTTHLYALIITKS